MNPTGFINLIFCTTMLLRCAHRRELMTVYWAAALVLVGLPLTFPSLVNFEERPTHVFAASVVNGCALFVLTFNILFAATASQVRSRRKSTGLPVYSNDFSPAQLAMISKAFWWACAAFVFSVPVLVWMTTGSLLSIGTYKWTDSAAMYEGESQYGYVAANTWFIVSS